MRSCIARFARFSGTSVIYRRDAAAALANPKHTLLAAVSCHRQDQPQFNASRRLSSLQAAEPANFLAEEVAKFDPRLSVEAAVTPPSSWFTDPRIYQLDKEAVLKSNWTVVGRSDQVDEAGKYFADTLTGEPFIVVRDQDGKLGAFYNVCRHHAAQIKPDCSSGCEKELVCPYHGWSYALDGRLKRAKRLKGIKDFKATQFGLVPIAVCEKWGFIFVNFSANKNGQESGGDDELEAKFAPVFSDLDSFGSYERLRFVRRVDYTVGCNWKVFVDNYLDGGYHVPVLHRDLTTNLDVGSYTTQVEEFHSLQKVGGSGDDDRIGKGAVYAYLYPNFMINRYGQWMDTNLVLPTGPSSCRVIYDYFMEQEKIDELSAASEFDGYLEKSLSESDQVHQEDAMICESVQRGLSSSGYDIGRYAPNVEMADHQFHLQLAKQYRQFLQLSESG